MSNYPKMLPEVMEAIETHFCDDKDIMADCMLYLLNATSREEDVGALVKWFDQNHRCDRCGSELSVTTYHEPHPEVGYGVFETMTQWYCHECGRYI